MGTAAHKPSTSAGISAGRGLDWCGSSTGTRVSRLGGVGRPNSLHAGGSGGLGSPARTPGWAIGEAETPEAATRGRARPGDQA